MPGKQINNAQVASYSKDLTPRASCALLISPPATPGTATRAWLSPDQQQAPDGWEGSRWKGEQWIKWCFQPLPRAEHCSFTAPGLEQVQGTRLQAQAEQMIYWQGAATATEMGTEAGVSSVTSPVLGQLARVSLQCPSPADGEGDLLTSSTHSMGCNRAPAQSHQPLQQNLHSLPVQSWERSRAHQHPGDFPKGTKARFLPSLSKRDTT